MIVGAAPQACDEASAAPGGEGEESEEGAGVGGCGALMQTKNVEG